MLQRAVAAFTVGAIGRITKLIPGLIGLPAIIAATRPLLQKSEPVQIAAVVVRPAS